MKPYPLEGFYHWWVFKGFLDTVDGTVSGEEQYINIKEVIGFKAVTSTATNGSYFALRLRNGQLVNVDVNLKDLLEVLQPLNKKPWYL